MLLILWIGMYSIFSDSLPYSYSLDYLILPYTQSIIRIFVCILLSYNPKIVDFIIGIP